MSNVDQILDEYARESQQSFSAEVLQAFIDRYPQHADALRSYSFVQIVFTPATREEIEAEEYADDAT